MSAMELQLEVREEWHTTKSGCESMTLGYDELNVRVFQRKPGGQFTRLLTFSGSRFGRREPDMKSLRTDDKHVALQRAELFLRALVAALAEPALSAQVPAHPAPPTNTNAAAPPATGLDDFTVEDLFTEFMGLARFKKLDRTTQYDYEKRAPIMLAGLGRKLPVRLIDHDILDEYALRRAMGGIAYRVRPKSRNGRTLSEREKLTTAVKARSVQSDLKLLRQMITWAITKKRPDGRRLLLEDVMAGYKIPEEDSPRRPVATDDRYTRTIAALERLALKADSPHIAFQYRMMRVVLITLAGTGRRRSAVLGLLWGDVCLLEHDGTMKPHIRFDRALDKAGRAAWLPLDPDVWEALQAWKEELGPMKADLIFPGIHERVPLSGRWAAELLDRAESEAGLAPLDGSLFHAYRRRFATARAHEQPKHVMELMGITDAKVFIDCYCHSTSEALRSTLSNARPVTDKRLEQAA